MKKINKIFLESTVFFILISIIFLMFILMDDGVIDEEKPGMMDNLLYQGGIFLVICVAEIFASIITFLFMATRIHMSNKSGR